MSLPKRAHERSGSSFAVAAPLAFPGPFDHDLVVPPTSGFQKLDLDGPQTAEYSLSH